MVEHLPCKQGVRSSTLLTSTKFDSNIEQILNIDNRIKKKQKVNKAKARELRKTIKLQRA